MDLETVTQKEVSQKEKNKYHILTHIYICVWTVVLEKTLLRVPWTARRSNQIILMEISPENSLKGLMLKLKLQYFGHLMWRTDSFEKTLMLGKSEGGRRRGQQRMRWLDGITDSMDMSLSKSLGVGDGQGSLACCSPRGCKESDTTERLNWTEQNTYMWKSRKWFRWSYLQNTKRDTDAENKDTTGEWGDKLGDWDWYTYSTNTVHKISTDN